VIAAALQRGAASYDAFGKYEARGDRFREIVGALG
jgi:UDP-N-acetylmuramoylalanine-D-glutamate ligase